MNILRCLGKIVCCVALCGALAGADSMQLRNGRHLQGKYVGGTATAIGFMTSGALEYFATSDVLALIFDGGNDSPGAGLQPSPMKGRSPARSSTPRVTRVGLSTPVQPRLRPASQVNSNATSLQSGTQRSEAQ